MDPSQECKPWRPCPNSHHHHLFLFPHRRHHHHHHPLVLCSQHHVHHHHRHHHHHLCYQPHRQFCPSFDPLPFPNPEAVGSKPLPNDLNSENVIVSIEAYDSGNQMLQEDEYEEMGGEDDDDEPMFVLTDEWKEFFAKSEAKRKMDKRLAKKKGKT